jgi:prepilin-type N-terminal cleavage/methylation domain-containing protein
VAAVRRFRGFTLIELLMVIVIIGILVSVLIPRFANSRDKAFVAAMKSDLRNLATAQESYYYDYAAYAPSVIQLPTFNATAGVSVTITMAGISGWSGTTTNINSTRQCFLFVGNAAPLGAATQEGQVACN